MFTFQFLNLAQNILEFWPFSKCSFLFNVCLSVCCAIVQLHHPRLFLSKCTLLPRFTRTCLNVRLNSSTIQVIFPIRCTFDHVLCVSGEKNAHFNCIFRMDDLLFGINAKASNCWIFKRVHDYFRILTFQIEIWNKCFNVFLFVN